MLHVHNKLRSVEVLYFLLSNDISNSIPLSITGVNLLWCIQTYDCISDIPFFVY